ncbi:hypothetical protein IFR05_008839 [Cadophora sp. M221]|nr:hypothetical protein IFR05_008839 [Cadophora sp. M221]
MSSIASRAKGCLAQLERLVGLLKQPDQQPIGLSATEAVDTLGRFRIWAANIGALQDIHTKSSLAYRVRDAPKISKQITELLDELAQSLDDVHSIASHGRENRTGALHEAELNPSAQTPESTDDIEHDKSDEEELSEIREIFASIDDAINNLFRFSIIIRNNTNRDRYAKAAAAAITNPFNDQFDICHVEHKFPTLAKRNDRWLIDRLGKAVTQRRQYLKYCREHHNKTAKEPQNAEPGIVVVRNLEASSQMPSRLVPSVRSDYSKPTSTLAPTQASTLILTSGQMIEEEVEDTQSQTSYTTSTDEESSNATLSVIKLEEVSKGFKQFECPYCWQIQTARNQKAWKKHVLSDLKPYVCTFEDCELKLFSDRHTWFSHELKDHRQEWRCYFCSHHPFDNPANYQRHLASRHPESFVKDQLPALLEMSQKALAKLSPTDCPFCDDWEQRLRNINPHIPATEALAVTPSQFQHHLGTHMEQLALFAIPRGYTEEGEADSGNAAPQIDSNASSLGNSDASSTLARELRLCEEIMNDLTEQSHLGYLSELTAIPPFYLWVPGPGRIKISPLSIPKIVQKLESGEYRNAADLLLDMNVFFTLLDFTHELGTHGDVRLQFDTLWEDKIGNAQGNDLRTRLKEEMMWKFWSATELSKPAAELSGVNVLITMKMRSGGIFSRGFDKAANIEHLYMYADCYELIGVLPRISLPPWTINYRHNYQFMMNLTENTTTSRRCLLDPNISIGELVGNSSHFAVLELDVGESPQISGMLVEPPIEATGKHPDTSAVQQPNNNQGETLMSSHDGTDEHRPAGSVVITRRDSEGTVEGRTELRPSGSSSNLVNETSQSKAVMLDRVEDAWKLTKKRFLASLNASDRKLFDTAGTSVLSNSTSPSKYTHPAFRTLEPLIYTIKLCGEDTDGYDIIPSEHILTILGSLRVALVISMPYESLLQRLVDTLVSIGEILPEISDYGNVYTLVKYPRFINAISYMYQELVQFFTEFRQTYRRKDEHDVREVFDQAAAHQLLADVPARFQIHRKDVDRICQIIAGDENFERLHPNVFVDDRMAPQTSGTQSNASHNHEQDTIGDENDEMMGNDTRSLFSRRYRINKEGPRAYEYRPPPPDPRDDHKAGTLVIIVLRARDLPDSSNDLFKVRLAKAENSDDVSWSVSSPGAEWNNDFNFGVSNFGEPYSLTIAVESQYDDFFGNALIDLSDLIVPGGGRRRAWYNLDPRGEIVGAIKLDFRFYASPPGTISAGSSSKLTQKYSVKEWAIKPRDEEEFDTIYNTVDKDNKGFISGDEGLHFFRGTKLPDEVLGKIWDLANISANRQLTREEFAIAMYFVRQQQGKSGGEYSLPEVLPSNLVPPSMRPPPPLPAEVGGNLDEDSEADKLKKEIMRSFERSSSPNVNTVGLSSKPAEDSAVTQSSPVSSDTDSASPDLSPVSPIPGEAKPQEGNSRGSSIYTALSDIVPFSGPDDRPARLTIAVEYVAPYRTGTEETSSVQSEIRPPGGFRRMLRTSDFEELGATPSLQSDKKKPSILKRATKLFKSTSPDKRKTPVYPPPRSVDRSSRNAPLGYETRSRPGIDLYPSESSKFDQVRTLNSEETPPRLQMISSKQPPLVPAPDTDTSKEPSMIPISEFNRRKVAKRPSTGFTLGAPSKIHDNSKSDLGKSLDYPDIPSKYYSPVEAEGQPSSSNIPTPKENRPTVIPNNGQYACRACHVSDDRHLLGYICGHFLHKECYEKASGCSICLRRRGEWRDGVWRPTDNYPTGYLVSGAGKK